MFVVFFAVYANFDTRCKSFFANFWPQRPGHLLSDLIIGYCLVLSGMVFNILISRISAIFFKFDFKFFEIFIFFEFIDSYGPVEIF